MKKLLVASVLLTAIAAGCGAWTGTPPGASAPSASATTGVSTLASPSASSSAAASPSAAVSSGVSASSTTDACGLLAKADVETLIGTVTDEPTATSAPLAGVADKASVCAFRGATGLLTVGVLAKAMARVDFDTAMRLVPGVQPISGVGDTAFGMSAGTNGANGASIFVLKGSTYFTLVATSSSTDGGAMLTSLTTLAKKAADQL